MNVEVRVHATRHGARGLYDGRHRHPFLPLVKGWRALAGRCDVKVIDLRQQDDPSPPPDGERQARLWDPADGSLARQHQRQPVSESDREREAPGPYDHPSNSQWTQGPNATPPFSLPVKYAAELW